MCRPPPSNFEPDPTLPRGNRLNTHTHAHFTQPPAQLSCMRAHVCVCVCLCLYIFPCFRLLSSI